MTTASEELHDIEEFVRLPLNDGTVIAVRISLIAAVKVGPGPRPKRDEVLMMRSYGEDQVLIISADLEDEPHQAVVIGGGGPPVVEA